MWYKSTMKKLHLNLIPLWFLILVFFFYSGGEGFPQEEKRTSPFIFIPDLRIWGLDIDVGYRGVRFFAGVDTILWVSAGGGYERKTFFHNPDGTIYNGGDPQIDPEKDPFFYRANVQWAAGISQGIISRGLLPQRLLPLGLSPSEPSLTRENARKGENVLEAFIFYKGRFDMHLHDRENPDQLIFRSQTIEDKDGVFQNSFLGGFTLDNIKEHRRSKVKEGYFAEISGEWGPEWFGNNIFGKADFMRFNLSMKGFIPLLDLYPENFMNILSIYAGAFISLDYFSGNSVPLNVRQTLGGRDPRTGLGGAVRGIDDGRFDAPFKVVGNLELRVNLPALIWKDLVPGLLLYFDSGYYNELNGSVLGFLFSAGGGLYLDFFNISELIVYTQYFLNGTNVNEKSFTPFRLGFGFHF